MNYIHAALHRWIIKFVNVKRAFFFHYDFLLTANLLAAMFSGEQRGEGCMLRSDELSLIMARLDCFLVRFLMKEVHKEQLKQLSSPVLTYLIIISR